jgi:hypothetical protein
MAEKLQYKRLTRGYPRSSFAVAFASRVSLWLGPDHLLQVDNAGYTETYKRFHFQDIQAIIVRKTKRFMVWNVILALPACACLLAVLPNLNGPNRSEPMAITCGVIAGLFLFFLLINLALGPTCTCQMQTAVQTEEIPALRRVRKTRKVLNRIYPLITAAQEGEGRPPISQPIETAAPPVEIPPIKMTPDPAPDLNVPPPPAG